MIVAPKSGRNVFGGFAQDDGVFSYRKIGGGSSGVDSVLSGHAAAADGVSSYREICGVPAVLVRPYPDTLQRLEKVVRA